MALTILLVHQLSHESFKELFPAQSGFHRGCFKVVTAAYSIQLLIVQLIVQLVLHLIDMSQRTSCNNNY